MANVLSTGAWLSAPTRKPSFFARLLRAQIEARQRHADHVVEQYLVIHGAKLTDDAERQSNVLFSKVAGSMVTLFILQTAHKVARFAKEVREIWHETRRLRRTIPGPTEE